MKARSQGYHIEGQFIQVHLLSTDHVSPNELVNIVEVPGFRDSAVVIAVRQLFPHDDFGLAQSEELLHVTWSVVLLASESWSRLRSKDIRHDLVLQPTQEKYGNFRDLRNHLLAAPVFVAERCQPLRHRNRVGNHLGDAEEGVLQNR